MIPLNEIAIAEGGRLDELAAHCGMRRMGLEGKKWESDDDLRVRMVLLLRGRIGPTEGLHPDTSVEATWLQAERVQVEITPDLPWDLL